MALMPALNSPVPSRVEISSMDFTVGKQTRLPDWECHQIFTFCRDSVTGTSFLKVTAFPKKEYPGNRPAKVIRRLALLFSAKITARIRDGRDSVSLYAVDLGRRGPGYTG